MPSGRRQHYHTRWRTGPESGLWPSEVTPEPHRVGPYSLRPDNSQWVLTDRPTCRDLQAVEATPVKSLSRQSGQSRHVFGLGGAKGSKKVTGWATVGCRFNR